MLGSFFRTRKSLTLLLFTISTRAKSDLKWSTAVTFGLAYPKPLFPVWIECSVDCVGSLVTSYSSPCSLFFIDTMLQVFLYSINIIEILVWLLSPSEIIRIPLRYQWKEFHDNSFFPRTVDL